MPYQHVCLESFGFTLPDEIVTSLDLERQLAPLYERLRLPEGRLELITGIRERRFWERGTLPSQKSVESARRALEVAELDAHRVGALVHASVCRDHLEPATACGVHHQLGLPAACTVYDLSNACLGILNGIVQIANMIELGQIEAGMVVGTEGSRQLVETTIQALNADTTLSRNTIKSAIASLTIGSASCAVLLTHRRISRTDNRLMHVAARAHSAHHQLCHSGQDEAVGSGMQPLMQTDSEQLLVEGIATGVATFDGFLERAAWTRDQLAGTFCHQVGTAHRKRMLDALGLDAHRDHSTVEWLGNTGSAALPTTMALGLAERSFQPGDRLAMLGIGSGINCLMLGVEWQTTRVLGNFPSAVPAPHWAVQRTSSPMTAKAASNSPAS